MRKISIKTHEKMLKILNILIFSFQIIVLTAIAVLYHYHYIEIPNYPSKYILYATLFIGIGQLFEMLLSKYNKWVTNQKIIYHNKEK